MKSKEAIVGVIKSGDVLLKVVGLDISQSGDVREIKKFNEVVGFCEQVMRIVETYPTDKEIVFLDCSCGKSYLSFALNYIFSNQFVRKTFFYGVDTNPVLIEKCEQMRESLGFRNMQFFSSRIIDFQPEKSVDMVIALHACDIATDETIAKGIKLGAKYIIVVPCCENQIRSRLKTGHPLVGLTDFGLLRYRFADILTEALRSQFLTGAGYHVKLTEIVSPRFTPKNLMIIARKRKENVKCNMDKYKKLDEMFNTGFILKSYFDESELRRGNCFSSVTS
ncbi:MAG: SAM-dependent methyltransferase [Candidatus Brocadia sp.]|jgi:hypothetical protein